MFQVKLFYDAGTPSSTHGVPRRAIACSWSFRITATKATLPGFPRRRPQVRVGADMTEREQV